MSTKIYNGYISRRPLLQTIEKLSIYAHKFKDLIEKEFHKVVADDLITRLDRKHKGEKEIEITGFWDFYDEKLKKVKETVCIGLREPDYDLTMSCELCQLNPRKTLILLYTENNEVTKKFGRLVFIDDYYYQNQCERPKEISSREWNKRRKDWDIVLDKQNSTFVRYEFHNWRFPFIDKKLIKKYAPSDEKRARVILKEEFIDSFISAIPLDPERSELNDMTDKVFRAIDAYAEYKETEEFKKALEEKIKVLPKLIFKNS